MLKHTLVSPSHPKISYTYSQKDLLSHHNLPEHPGVMRKARLRMIPAFMDLNGPCLTDFIVNLGVGFTIVTKTKGDSNI